MERASLLHILLIVLFLLVSQRSMSQEAAIQGSVRDSVTNYTLSGVTVAAYYTKDSSLADVQLTNNIGGFSLKINKAKDDINLYVSFTGYQTFHLFIHGDTAHSVIDLGTLRMKRNYEQLEEVVIHALPPVKMNGDTLEINPGAFRMGPNAVVEDLLRRVNGIVVWGDGTITVNGKKVTNVYVDGKPFLSNDARVATQNLPKNIIDKVQVYQEGNNKEASTGFGISDSLLTMNIQLKKGSKHGYLGKAEAALGTAKKYEVNATGILFTELSKLALVAGKNNINKKISSVSSALENSTFKNPNPNLSNAPDFEMDGMNTSAFYGAIVQHSFKPGRKPLLVNDISAEIIRHENRGDLNTEIFRNTLVDKFEQNSHQRTNEKTMSNETGGNLSFKRRTHNTNLLLSADLNFFMNKIENNSIIEISEGGLWKSKSDWVNATNNNGNNLAVHGKYNYVDERNLGLKSYSIDFDAAQKYQVSNRSVVNDFTSYVSGVQDIFLDRKYHSNNETKEGKINITYHGLKRMLLGKRDVPGLSLSLSNQLNITGESFGSEVLDFDTISNKYLSNATLSYTNQSDTFQTVPALIIAKAFQKHLEGRFYRSYRIGMKLKQNILILNNSSDIHNRNLRRSFNYFEPEFSLSFFHSNNSRELTLSYKNYSSHRAPGIEMLFPVVDNIDQYNIMAGNPNLKNETTFSNEISILYLRSKRGSKSHFSVSGKAGLDRVQNAISDSILIDNAGRRKIYPVNIGWKKQLNATLEIIYSTKLGKQLLQFRYAGDYLVSKVPGFINSSFIVSNYNTFNHKISATYSLSDRLTTEISQSVSMNNFQFSSEGGSVLKNDLYLTRLSTNFNFTSRCILSSTAELVSSPSLEKKVCALERLSYLSLSQK